jgi:hypothetical protein
MPRTSIAVVQAALAGIALGGTASDTVNGNEFANADGKTYLHLQNSGASTRLLTIQIQNTTRPGDGQFPAVTMTDATVSVVAGAEMIVGPIPPCYVTSGGKVEVDGAHAELLLSPFRLG